MSLLQETTPTRDFSGREKLKVKSEETNKMSLPTTGYPFPPSVISNHFLAMMNQSYLANMLNMHPPWQADSSPSPPIISEAMPPRNYTFQKRNINNNNIVTSTSADGRKKRNSHKEDNISTPLPVSHVHMSSTSPSGPEIKETNRDKQFTCGVCKRSFGYKHVLQNHERTHTGEKPFECPECHKRFTRDHHLKTHMRLHTGERPYHCEHCDRQFVQVANLRRHLRVHTGERPYSCDYCTAKFSDSNQLKAHTLVHTNEKPYFCDRCQHRFRRRHHFLHHKCGLIELSPVLDEQEEERKRRRIIIPHTPITLTLSSDIPIQTEPEDLSMSTGALCHSSGDSSSSGSSSMREDVENEDEPKKSAAIFLKKEQDDAHC